MVEKMTATVTYALDAAKDINRAAERLELQDAWHLEHARALVENAIRNLNLVVRQIDRAQQDLRGSQ